MKESKIMQYLGKIHGAGSLTCGGETIARAEYDLDGFLMKLGQVTGSGEIRMAPEALRDVFGRKDLHLLTDNGRRFSLRFSEKRLRSASDAAHVDITGNLPRASEWRH
jgi:hypothetical protein